MAITDDRVASGARKLRSSKNAAAKRGAPEGVRTQAARAGRKGGASSLGACRPWGVRAFSQGGTSQSQRVGALETWGSEGVWKTEARGRKTKKVGWEGSVTQGVRDAARVKTFREITKETRQKSKSADALEVKCGVGGKIKWQSLRPDRQDKCYDAVGGQCVFGRV